MPKFQLDKWVEINGFTIRAEATGRKHRFEYDKHKVTISVPTQSKKHEDRLDLISWKKGKRKKPLVYVVNHIRITIEINDVVSIGKNYSLSPSKSLGRASISPKSAKRLDNYAQHYEQYAEEIIDYWLTVLRWKSDNFSIGRKRQHQSSTSSRLLVTNDQNKFWWNSPVHLTAYISDGLSLKEWQEVAKILKAGVRPPPWNTFLMQGQYYLRLSEFQESIICFAIASESLMRTLFIQEIQPPNLKKMNALKQISIRNIRESWKDFSFWKSGDEAHFDEKGLAKLFETRNSIMHSGNSKLDKKKCKEYQDMCKKFIARWATDVQ